MPRAWRQIVKGALAGILIVIGLALLGGSVSEIIFGAHGQRFSRASQITPDNVTQLEPAWTYSTGDIGTKSNAALSRSAGETTPILVHGNLVFCSPFNEVIAIDLQQRPANQFICRGVAAYGLSARPSRTIPASKPPAEPLELMPCVRARHAGNSPLYPDAATQPMPRTGKARHPLLRVMLMHGHPWQQISNAV
jgi:hypothetical protein